jgi:hypothetical protein
MVNIKSKKYLYAKEKLNKKLQKQQFRGSIKDNKFLLIDLNYKNGGFGSQFNTINFCLRLGLLFDRTVVFDFSNFGYANLFEDLSKFSIKDLKDFKKVKLDFSKKQNDKVVYFDFAEYFHKSNKPYYDWVPEFWKNSNLDLDFLEGVILSNIKIKKEELSKIKKIEKEIGFKNPIIGVQIRRGDKYTESKPVSIEKFFEKISKISNKNKVKNVFVTSDSDKTFKELPKNLDLNYIYDKNEKRYNVANHLIASKNKELGYQEAFTGLKIIYLLSNCDYLVGQKNTHLMNIASKLKLAKTGSKGLALVGFDYYSNGSKDFFVKKIVRIKRLIERIKLLLLR